MKNVFKFSGFMLIAIVLAACSSTTVFITAWKSPDAAPVGELNGQKVVAFVLVQDQIMRRSGEDALAAELTRRGVTGIPGYTLVPDVTDEAKAREIIEKAGAEGAVAMRPVAREKQDVLVASYYTSPAYRPYWGGYWHYGWGGAWSGQQVRTNTMVSVETLVYSLRQNKLLWAGTTKTTNPSDVGAFVKEVIGAAVREMKKAGVL